MSKLLETSNLRPNDVSCVIVGNMVAPMMSKQSQLAAAILSRIPGFGLKDSFTVDAASASGAAAVRLALLACLSGVHKNVIALGVEQMLLKDDQCDNHKTSYSLTEALAQASDWKTQGSAGKTFMSLNDDLMSAYLERYGREKADDFFYISENAHLNALNNPNAVFKSALSKEQYKTSKFLGKSVKVLDACPTCNGAAGILISTEGKVGEHAFISGSESSLDNIILEKRPDALNMPALSYSVQSCLRQSGITHKDIDFYEVHDAYSIMSVLCLENAGFVPKGKGLEFAKAGEIRRSGLLPISTLGGLKARGHPVGSSGVYQIVEAIAQLKGTAGESQVRRASRSPKFALTSSFGGAATTVISHVLAI